MDELKEAAQSLKETYQAPTTPGSTETEQSVKTDSTEPTPSDLAALAEANEANDDVQHSSKTVTENTEHVIKPDVPVTKTVTVEKKTTDQANGEH